MDLACWQIQRPRGPSRISQQILSSSINLRDLDKYISQFGKIYFEILTNGFGMLTNTTSSGPLKDSSANLVKFHQPQIFRQIHFVIWKNIFWNFQQMDLAMLTNTTSSDPLEDSSTNLVKFHQPLSNTNSPIFLLQNFMCLKYFYD